MIAEGALDGVAGVSGIHVMPMLPSGTIASKVRGCVPGQGRQLHGARRAPWKHGQPRVRGNRGPAPVAPVERRPWAVWCLGRVLDGTLTGRLEGWPCVVY